MSFHCVAPIKSSSIIVPCPCCGKPLEPVSVKPTPLADDLEDVTEACLRCGTELVRTISVRPNHFVAA